MCPITRWRGTIFFLASLFVTSFLPHTSSPLPSPAPRFPVTPVLRAGGRCGRCVCGVGAGVGDVCVCSERKECHKGCIWVYAFTLPHITACGYTFPPPPFPLFQPISYRGFIAHTVSNTPPHTASQRSFSYPLFFLSLHLSWLTLCRLRGRGKNKTNYSINNLLYREGAGMVLGRGWWMATEKSI